MRRTSTVSHRRSHAKNDEHAEHIGCYFLRMTPGAQNLSPEMLDILARLIYDDYELFPSQKKS